jgi:ABC-type branched-subunit amino acid transport system substrate-binding protein
MRKKVTRMNTRRRARIGIRKATAALSAVTLALALAACGEGAGSKDSNDGTVSIGLLIPLTGEYGDFGATWQKAVEMIVEEANATGALPDGATLKIEVADEATGDAEQAVEAARKMIDSQGVSAIVGPTSGPMLALEPIAKRSRIPVISSSAGSVALSRIGGEYLFRTVPSDDDDRIAIAKFLESKNATKLSMFVENSPSPISTAAATKEAFEAQGGTVLKEVRVNPGESSYRAAVGQVLADDPPWIMCACSQQAGTSILKELSSAGYEGERLVTPDLTTSGAIKAVGQDAMQGAYGEVAAADNESVVYKDFVAKYTERNGEEELAPLTANTYDATAIVILAMIASGSTQGSDVAEMLADVSSAPGKKVSTVTEGAAALAAGEDIDYDGASGPVELDKTGTAASSYSILQATGPAWKQVMFIPAKDIADAKKD